MEEKQHVGKEDGRFCAGHVEFDTSLRHLSALPCMKLDLGMELSWEKCSKTQN